jgi:hypothetical protein
MSLENYTHLKHSHSTGSGKVLENNRETHLRVALPPERYALESVLADKLRLGAVGGAADVVGGKHKVLGTRALVGAVWRQQAQRAAVAVRARVW